MSKTFLELRLGHHAFCALEVLRTVVIQLGLGQFIAQCTIKGFAMSNPTQVRIDIHGKTNTSFQVHASIGITEEIIISGAFTFQGEVHMKSGAYVFRDGKVELNMSDFGAPAPDGGWLGSYTEPNEHRYPLPCFLERKSRSHLKSTGVKVTSEEDWGKVLALPWSSSCAVMIEAVHARGDAQLTKEIIKGYSKNLVAAAGSLNQVLRQHNLMFRFTYVGFGKAYWGPYVLCISKKQ